MKNNDDEMNDNQSALLVHIILHMKQSTWSLLLTYHKCRNYRVDSRADVIVDMCRLSPHCRLSSLSCTYTPSYAAFVYTRQPNQLTDELLQLCNISRSLVVHLAS